MAGCTSRKVEHLDWEIYTCLQFDENLLKWNEIYRFRVFREQWFSELEHFQLRSYFPKRFLIRQIERNFYLI